MIRYITKQLNKKGKLSPTSFQHFRFEICFFLIYYRFSSTYTRLRGTILLKVVKLLKPHTTSWHTKIPGTIRTTWQFVLVNLREASDIGDKGSGYCPIGLHGDVSSMGSGQLSTYNCRNRHQAPLLSIIQTHHL